MDIAISQISCSLTPDEELQSKIDDLAASIREQGLFHPITVHLLNTSPASYEVVAGKKRFIALKQEGYVSVPCEVKQNLDEYQKEEIALHENLKRGQLPWHEEVELVQKLHDLRQRQHGAQAAQRPATGEKKGWGMRDTAAELGKALGGESMDIQLARMVKINPALRNIKDKATAIKVVKQTAKRFYAEEEQLISGMNDCADECYMGDGSEILQNLPENIFDFCITDPPWLRFAKVDDPTLRRDEFTLPVFKALYRCMKWDSVMFVFVGADDFEYYKQQLPKIGWKVQGHPCVWAKEGSLSRTGVKSWETGRDLELILVAAKGSPVLSSSTQVSSLFRHAVVPSKHLVHPNEKPVGLLRTLAELCSYDGSLGVDPFAGSGAFGEMCKTSERHYTLIERDPERFKKIVSRLKKKKSDSKTEQ